MLWQMMVGCLATALSFGRRTGAASQQLPQLLRSPNAAGADDFGTSLALSDPFLVVGAPGPYPSTSSTFRFLGAAYVYHRAIPSGDWVLAVRLEAGDTRDLTPRDRFGQSVAMERLSSTNVTYLLVGAPYLYAAYLFAHAPTSPPGVWAQVASWKEWEEPGRYGPSTLGSAVSISGRFLGFAIVWDEERGCNVELYERISAASADGFNETWNRSRPLNQYDQLSFGPGVSIALAANSDQEPGPELGSESAMPGRIGAVAAAPPPGPASVPISAFLVVGSPHDNLDFKVDTGTVFPYVVSTLAAGRPPTAPYIYKLAGPDGTHVGNLLGAAVAADAHTGLIAMGAPGVQFAQGTVYLIRAKSPVGGGEVHPQPDNAGALRWQGQDSGPNARFGSALAFSTDAAVLAVGAPGAAATFPSDDGSGSRSASDIGRVVVYARSPVPAGGELTAALFGVVAELPSAQDIVSFFKWGDTPNLGTAVALSADGATLAVGAPGNRMVLVYQVEPDRPPSHGKDTAWRWAIVVGGLGAALGTGAAAYWLLAAWLSRRNDEPRRAVAKPRRQAGDLDSAERALLEEPEAAEAAESPGHLAGPGASSGRAVRSDIRATGSPPKPSDPQPGDGEAGLRDPDSAGDARASAITRRRGLPRPAATADESGTASASSMAASTEADCLIDLGDFDPARAQALGTGSSGEVFRAVRIDCGLPVAVKLFFGDMGATGAKGEPLPAALLHEVSLLQRLRHPHIVGWYGIIKRPRPGLVCEFMERGSLWSALGGRPGRRRARMSNASPLDRAHQRRIALDVARGMAYLHAMHILHLDLKSPNILISDDGRAKVADFGLARVLPAADLSSQATTSAGAPTGTYHWMAPECMRGDVYSYGVVLYELLTGSRPWHTASSAAEVIAAVGWQGRRVELPAPPPEGATFADGAPPPPAFCPLLSRLMEACLVSDPAARPTFLELTQRLEGADA